MGGGAKAKLSGATVLGGYTLIHKDTVLNSLLNRGELWGPGPARIPRVWDCEVAVGGFGQQHCQICVKTA